MPYPHQPMPPNTSPQPASPLRDYTLRTQPEDAPHGGPSQRVQPHLHSPPPQQSFCLENLLRNPRLGKGCKYFARIGYHFVTSNPLFFSHVFIAFDSAKSCFASLVCICVCLLLRVFKLHSVFCISYCSSFNMAWNVYKID